MLQGILYQDFKYIDNTFQLFTGFVLEYVHILVLLFSILLKLKPSPCIKLDVKTEIYKVIFPWSIVIQTIPMCVFTRHLFNICTKSQLSLSPVISKK